MRLNRNIVSRNDASDNVLCIILFLINPFISFIYASRNPLKKFNQWIIVAYFGLIGFSRRLAELGDARSWTDQMIVFSKMGFKYGFLAVHDSYYNFAYILSIYLLSYIKYTAIIWSIIFMLTIKLFLYIYELQFKEMNINRNKVLSFNNFVIFIFFIFFIPMTSYGVKFWVALDFFLLGYYIYMCKGSNVGLLIIVTSVLFHYTFAYMVILFFAWFVFYHKPFYSFFLIFLLPILYYISLSFSDAFIDNKLEAYSSGSLIEQRALWLRYDRILSAIFSLVTLMWVFLSRKYLKSKTEKGMLFFLVIFALGLIPLIPMLDGLDRFSRVFTFMMLIFFARLIRENNLKIKGLFYISLPVFCYHLLTNYFMRKGEWDLDIFYNTMVHFLSSDLMTKIV